MGNLLRCYRNSTSVIYFSKLPTASSSAPCIPPVLTHSRGCVKMLNFDTPSSHFREDP